MAPCVTVAWEGRAYRQQQLVQDQALNTYIEYIHTYCTQYKGVDKHISVSLPACLPVLIILQHFCLPHHPGAQNLMLTTQEPTDVH